MSDALFGIEDWEADPKAGPSAKVPGPGKNGSHAAGTGGSVGEENARVARASQPVTEVLAPMEAIGAFAGARAAEIEILAPEEQARELLATLQASVVLRHRGLYSKHYTMVETLNEMLTRYLQGKLSKEDTKLLFAGKASVPAYLVAMTGALERLVRMERRSYGLANDSSADGTGEGNSTTVFNIVIGTEEKYREHQRQRLLERQRQAVERREAT